MGVNQVKFGDATVMDISDSTVAPETLLSGVTAYNKAGNKITGEVVVEHVEVEPVLETGTKSATITVGEESADIYCENTKAEVKNMKTTQSATITNGVAQFECIDKNFVKALKLTMEPIQDLHGYDHPWVGGAGKNKAPVFSPYSAHSITLTNGELGELIINGTPDAQVDLYVNLPVLESGTYTVSANNNQTINSTNTYFECLDANNSRLGAAIYSVLNSNFTFTGAPSRLKIRFDPGVTFTNFILKIQLESGSAATDYAPYENICPISGRTEANVTRTGKNVFNLEKYLTDNNITYTKDGEWFIFSIYSALYANKFTLPELGYYSGQLIIDSERTVATNVNLRAYKNGSAVIQGQTFTNQQIDQVGFNYSTTGQVCCKVQAEYGASNTPYEPYTAETHTHKYPQEILGGVDDFVNGGATVTHNVTNPTIKGVYTGSYNNISYANVPKGADNIAKGNFAFYGEMSNMCECLERPSVGWDDESNIGKMYNAATNTAYWIGVPKGTTLAEAQALYNGLQLYYKLATPTTIQTSAEEITTVEGTNIISGTEPISECSYRVLEENLSDTIYSNETLVGEDSDVYTFRTTPNISDANYVEEKMVGGSVAFNQLIQNGNFINTDNWTASASITFTTANNIASLTNSLAGDKYVYQNVGMTIGHKYLYLADIMTSVVDNTSIFIIYYGESSDHTPDFILSKANTWYKRKGIFSCASNRYNIVRMRCPNTDVTTSFKNIVLIDLTLMFGSAVADYIYNLENTTAGTGVAFLQKYGFFTKNYYDYNTGSLQSVNFNKWFKTSKNLFNPNRMQGDNNIIDGNDVYVRLSKGSRQFFHDYKSYIPGNRTYTFQFDPPSDIAWTYVSLRCRLKDNSDYGNVGTIDGWTYWSIAKGYNRTFENASHVEITVTIPDCLYCEFGIGTNNSFENIKESGTYVKFSNIQLEVGSVATDYEPYEGYEISLDDNLDLRGLFRIADNKLIADGDIYEGDGKITRKYGIVDLGDLTWAYEGSETPTRFRATLPLNPKILGSGISSKNYLVNTQSASSLHNGEFILSGTSAYPYLRIRDDRFTSESDFTTAVTGIKLLYELAEPILNRGTNFDSPHVFIHNGNEYFVKTYTSTPDRDIDIPAGHVGKYYGKSMFKEISLPTIPKSGGTYILKCNVLADGNKKLYWCADNN